MLRFLRHPLVSLLQVRWCERYFDPDWYLQTYRNAVKTRDDAIVHYLTKGWRRGYDPSAHFSTDGYLEANPDVAARGMNPLVHYARFGRREGRSVIGDAQVCRSLFDTAARQYVAPSNIETTWLSIVVPVWETNPHFLDQLLNSFVSQGIDGVELILVDDGSTKQTTTQWLEDHSEHASLQIVRRGRNGGIVSALNDGLRKANGTWVTFLDHDDAISPHGLVVLGNALLSGENVQFCYTDEAVTDAELQIRTVFWKPAFDPVLLSGVNYLNHFSVFRRDRLEQIGGLRSGTDGSQDHDLLLRYLDGLRDDEILHVPYPAYLWRRTEEAYSARFLEKSLTNARKALSKHYTGPAGSVTVTPVSNGTLHKVNFEDRIAPWPTVSVVIPNRDSPELIGRVLADIFDCTDYAELEVIVVDNGTSCAEVLALYQKYEEKHANFAVSRVEESFNFSRMVNRGLAMSRGDHVLLLNNDIEVEDPSWLREMVSCFSYPDVGIVGAKLLYPDRTIQHAGVIAGLGGYAGHWYIGEDELFGGPMNRLHVRNSVTCVTGAAMLIHGDCLRRLGTFDEENFSVAYNDVDFCLRAYKEGFRAVWTPFACLIHHESSTRGSDETLKNHCRFKQEKLNLERIHRSSEFLDPALNPIYGRSGARPNLKADSSIAHPQTWFEQSQV